jgi:two-component system CheB/CheR fusion protein
VRSATGVDFTHYKRGTLERRIKRRMALRGFEKLEDYSRDLEQNRQEASALCENCFITVTAFFREPAVFEELRKKVFPALLENRAPEDAIRIWVAGCASGEEAYSIAICLKEFLDEQPKHSVRDFRHRYQRNGDRTGRRRILFGNALARISPERLARFFTRTERGYQVATIIRNSCLFARHNVAQDPPFSRLDLVSCCNVLIYLGAELQRKVMSILHYALKPAGFLVLGPSESVGTLSSSFHQVPGTHKIYCTTPTAGTPPLPPGHGRYAEVRVDRPQRVAEGRPALDVLREADSLVLATHGPPGAVIDEDMNIIQVRGHTAPYLSFRREPTHNLLKLAREGLIAGLGKAIRSARHTNSPAREDGFRIEGGGQLRDVAINVTPFGGSPPSKDRYFLVWFEDAAPGAGPRTKLQPAIPDNGRAARLRREVVATKEYLQSIVEENATTLRNSGRRTGGQRRLETAQENWNRQTKN